MIAIFGLQTNKSIRNHFPILAFYCLGVTALTWVSRNDPFFWDTVQLGSKHAHFFYQNGMRWLPLPIEVDSGHPPVFGYYLALVWTLFGKTMPASHIAMLPFLLLIVIMLWRLGRQVAGNAWGAWLPAIVLLDPVFLGQAVMVSPDLVVVAGFLCALTGILEQRKYWVLLGVLGLCTVSMRGMMTAAALLSWAALLPFFKDFDVKKLWKSALPFLPGFAFAAWFNLWHWRETGWIGYHPGSPWASAFNMVDFQGFLRNVAVVGWRWLDFGRVGELLLFLALFIGIAPRSRALGMRLAVLGEPYAMLLLCLLAFSLPSALLYQNLSAHRYMLPAFLTMHLLVFQWIVLVFKEKSPSLSLSSKNRVKAGLLLLLLSLASGNFWVYPRGVSMGWDSTLAHWPYHSLRAKALQFLESQNADFSRVGTAFPNINTGEDLMLNGDLRQFSVKDLSVNQYVLASNVFNDFSEADFVALSLHWHLIWQEKKGGVWMEIYSRQ